MILIYIVMIISSPSIGRWVQHTPNRLKTLLTTIFVNRGSVVIGSFIWLLILSQEDLLIGDDHAAFVLETNHVLKHVLFVIAVAFGIIERLSASGNMISMERDWVVAVAAPPRQPYDLTHLNAVMRRIDLVCKLISPILISVVISAAGSTRVGVIFTGLTSLLSLPVEAVFARRVWASSPALQVLKHAPMTSEGAVDTLAPEDRALSRVATTWYTRARHFFLAFEQYFATSVWMPSVALAMLHFNVVTWRATLITYLINVDYSLNVITLARAIGSIFEVSSTIATPRGIEYIAQQHRSKESSDEDESRVGLMERDGVEGEDDGCDVGTVIGLQRFGLWGLSWQVVNTVSYVHDLQTACNSLTQGRRLSS